MSDWSWFLLLTFDENAEKVQEPRLLAGSWQRDWGGTRPPRILVVGSGDLAARVLSLLAHSSTPRVVGVLGRRADAVQRLSNLVRQTAIQHGGRVDVSAFHADLSDEARTATALGSFAPDIIFNAASIQSWHVVTGLSERRRQAIAKAHFGPWLPMHLAPVLKLMRAVRACGSDALVINAAYPDAVHPVLATANLSPHAGIGNVANPTAGLRLVAAAAIGCSVHDLTVRFIAHHYTSHRIGRSGNSGGAPCALRFFLDGEDVTRAAGDPENLFAELARHHGRPSGMTGQTMTSASAMSILQPLLDGTSRLAHSPGVDGRVGGYPVRVANRAIHVDLPHDIDLATAQEINTQAQVFDGIERIDSDGTVTFTDTAVDVMRSELQYHCKRMPLTDVDECASELRRRYLDYAKVDAAA
ncbi:hypothetical protein OG194_33420 [Streptomyces sp. NBC_01288]|uniref:hypothetical protein n=1 Tax=Streptomyces sp. NBC_01288 TaxID=2903814 RepID=UPI002E15EA6D|nr:hypothetical protein OG194_33420 [Streptomyces sp. NBC_01288]